MERNAHTSNSEVVFKLALVASYLPPAQGASFLDQYCALQRELRAAVEHLLNQLPARIPAAGMNSRVGALPAHLPPYRLVRKIGAGGMGEVYLAEQTQPRPRRVALKFLKQGLDTPEAVAQFEAEQEALGRMNHPNVVKILGEGTTPEGRPYFVMEYAAGTAITTYCDQARLSLHQRIHLFIQVCQAIEHAHRQGIVHRDIKPSNILVASHAPTPGQLKVIDFGAAHATPPAGAGAPDRERTKPCIGTPAYMSPEQRAGDGRWANAGSDVYALGVLLYELLVGLLPFDASSRGVLPPGLGPRIAGRLKPKMPSQRLADIGRRPAGLSKRRTDAASLAGCLRGDLDWIAMKALQMKPHRRYETARGMAADLWRFLNGRRVARQGPPVPEAGTGQGRIPLHPQPKVI